MKTHSVSNQHLKLDSVLFNVIFGISYYIHIFIPWYIDRRNMSVMILTGWHQANHSTMTICRPQQHISMKIFKIQQKIHQRKYIWIMKWVKYQYIPEIKKKYIVIFFTQFYPQLHNIVSMVISKAHLSYIGQSYIYFQTYSIRDNM